MRIRDFISRRRPAKVSELMTSEVEACRPDDNLETAARMMWNGDIGVVPVIDDQRRVLGIVTDRDIAMAAYTQGKPLRDLPVDVAMAREIFSCRADDPVATAEHIMRARQVRRLPVIDDEGKLAGILSLNDIARAWAVERGPSDSALQSDAVAATLGAICLPRPASAERKRMERAARAAAS